MKDTMKANVAKVSKAQMSTTVPGDDDNSGDGDGPEASSLLVAVEEESSLYIYPSLKLDTIKRRRSPASHTKWKRPLLIASILFLTVLLVPAALWLGGYRRQNMNEEDPVWPSTYTTTPNSSSNDHEPRSVPCYEGDFILCYEGACTISCNEGDQDGCCTQEISPSDMDRCRNESYVNFLSSSPIPSEIGWFTELKSFRVNSGGPSNFPSEIWTLTSLQNLEFGWVDVFFDFPTEVGQLTGLTRLDVVQVMAQGRLWTDLGKLTNLEYFRVAWTDLTGTIPSEIGLLTKLTELDLAAAGSLTGTIPTEIGMLTNLKNLDLQQATLSGPLPTEIGELSGLTSLSLFQNFGLEGPIPSQLGNLMNLTKGFNLFHTGLFGSIPVELCSLTLEDQVHDGFLISCDNFDCECCVNADVPRNFNFPPCRP